MQSIPNVVKCPVTDIEHSVVMDDMNMEKLREWVQDIHERMDSGIEPIIAIDCEGYMQGLAKNSLGMIQITEVLEPGFLETRNHRKADLNMRPGFLILNPYNSEVIRMMSVILNHRKIRMISFDFTADFSAMLDAGYEIKMEKVFDCQIFGTFEEEIDFIKYKNATSLRRMVIKAKTNNISPEKIVDNVHRIDFDLKEYEISRFDAHDRFRQMINLEMLQYGSVNLAFITIAAIDVVCRNSAQKVRRNSRNKVTQFQSYTSDFNSYLAPECIRQSMFLDFDKLSNPPNTLPEARKLFSKFMRLQLIQQVLPANLLTGLPTQNIDEELQNLRIIIESFSN